MSLTKILAELPRLKASELDAVAAACVRLKGRPKAEDTPAHLLGLIGDLIGDPTTYAKFRKMKQAGEWRTNMAGVVSFVDLVWPGSTRTEGTAIVSLCLEMLIADLKERNVPVTLDSVCSNLGRVPQVFDANFPGYREHGLAKLILQKIGVGK